MKKVFTVLFLFSILSGISQMSLVTNFGSNPGFLAMYKYVPVDPQANAPVVLVMHGCGQLANDFANETGWNDLADQYGFYVIHAGQSTTNNGSKCFNWFSPLDYSRDVGEAKSLAQMVDYIHANYNTNPNRTYVCGLSAGGSMTSVMMAAYPDKFHKAGIWAGVTYRYSALGNNNKTPQEWGDFVRNEHTSYTGEYPTLFVCQGTNDAVVDPVNESRLVDQWTNIHGVDQISDQTTTSFQGNTDVTENIYKDASLTDTIVVTYTINNMAHGIAVNPGTGQMEGGQTSLGAFDVDFFSTYWMASFFGLITNQNSTSLEQNIQIHDVQLIKRENNIHLKTTLDEKLNVSVYSLSGQLLLFDTFEKNIDIDSQIFNSNLVLFVVNNSKNECLFAKAVNK